MNIRNSILLGFLTLGFALSGSLEAKTHPHRTPVATQQQQRADGSSQEFGSLMDLARSAGISKTKAGNMSLDGRPDAHGRRIERIGKQTGSTRARAVKVIHANGRTHTYPSATAAAKSQGISLATVLNKLSKGSRDAKGRRYQYAD